MLYYFISKKFIYIDGLFFRPRTLDQQVCLCADFSGGKAIDDNQRLDFSYIETYDFINLWCPQ